jgi:FRG domain-containing protein
MAVDRFSAGSLREVLQIASQIKRLWNPSCDENQELWFRGHSKRSHTLAPGLYRKYIVELAYDEYTNLKVFRNLATSKVERAETSWDWYILAQHYGLPTRLLDWSEALLPAVFFALEPHVMPFTRKQHDSFVAAAKEAAVYDDDSPTVWVLEPACLNAWAGHGFEIFSLDDELEELEPYQWTNIHDAAAGSAEKPLAVHPRWANPRILAQQGKFTVHGTQPTPLEELADLHSDIRLAQIVLDRGSAAHIWDELETAGVWRLGLFPELDSVSSHIKWHYQGVRRS